jgi:hypothetical protein
MDEVKSRLADLASLISAGRIGSAEFWVGADVAILDSEPEARQPGFYPDPRWVVTPNAAELSWLFHELRDAFIDHYDGQSKIELFGRLANAAGRYQSRVGEGGDPQGLLGAVLHEAQTIADGMERGTFHSFAIALGNEIVDDYTTREP